jgi:hypothetical protein
LGRFPTIARYSDGYGIFACNAGNPYLWPNEVALSGYLEPLYTIANTFPIAGNACSAAFDIGLSELHTVIGDGSSIRYLVAYFQLGQWGTSTPELIANASGPFTIELYHYEPFILYELNGQVYLASGGSGHWTSEFVAEGYVGWRSLAIAPDGKIYALIGQADQLRILSRGSTGWTIEFTVSGVPSHSTRGSGSIIAPVAGDVRVAFRKSVDGGTSMGVGYVALAGSIWNESLVTTSAYVSPPAIAVSAIGETLISWGDEHQDLRLSRGNLGSWQDLYIDALGVLAEQTDIGVDSSGNIFILYSDFNGPAKVAVGQ